MGEAREPKGGPDTQASREGVEVSAAADPATAWEELEALVDTLVRSLSQGLDRDVAGLPEPAASLGQATAVRLRLAEMREALLVRDRRFVELRSQQDEFLSVVAHDLRTPLVAIQGFAQLLLVSGDLGERQRTYVERILQGVRAMSRLVEDLRTARRLDQGALALQHVAVDPAEFAADLVEMHREEARQKEIEIQLETPPPLPRLRCDPERLGQALGNLVQNAVKFSPRGSGVVVRVRAEGGHLRFEVADRGPGIDEALLPRLFERFTQGAPAEAEAGKGFGLGLHICREIVALHGGRVGARNQAQGGSCFWAEVPLGAAEPVPKPAGSPGSAPP